MRITLEIEEAKLQSILEITKQSKKSPAIMSALDEFLLFKQKQAFIVKVLGGQTDYTATNEQVEEIARLEDL